LNKMIQNDSESMRRQKSELFVQLLAH